MPDIIQTVVTDPPGHNAGTGESRLTGSAYIEAGARHESWAPKLQWMQPADILSLVF